MSPATLEVHLYGQHVADVIDAGGGECAIQYRTDAVRIGTAARLSLALPVREQLYPSTGHGTRWVRSLLPEGRALDWAVQTLNIAHDDRFALLASLGRDVAGAATIVLPGSPPEEPSPGYEPLNADDLARLVSRTSFHPLALGPDRKVRLSLAGMQDKIVLHRPPRSRRWYLPVGGAPSTVIVKPPPAPPTDGATVGDGLVSNEAFCLQLAASARLPVASWRIERFGDAPCLAIDRYDRRTVNGRVERIHQEDLVSAMGRDPAIKYELPTAVADQAVGGFAERRPIRNVQGPTLDDIATVIADHAGRGAIARLVDIVTFNVAIGNADAHARNLSVLLDIDGSVRLAPMYDLVATRHWPDFTREPAQLVDGIDDIDDITVGHIANHAMRWQLPHRAVRERGEHLLDRIERSLDKAGQTTVERGADATVVDEVREATRRRITRMRR